MILIYGCKEPQVKELKPTKQLKNTLIKVNKDKVKLENEQIDAFLKRYKWPVIKTGTGLRYCIYKNGEGDLVKDNQMVKIDYAITLLNGDTAYSSYKTGPQEFLVGMDDVESGLHEGIKYMKEGDRAKLILPSYLAHGLIGDSKRIPPRATIIYDIELLKIK